MMRETLVEKVQVVISRFIAWLEYYGESSWDYQSFFASDRGRNAKALYYRKPLLGALGVAPMVLSEAFLPSVRKHFWKPQRFPIADAHYAMGFACLSQALGEKKYYQQAVHFLEVLAETRCPGYRHYCWGYPFHWETVHGTIKEGTPLITTVPYVYEAFSQIYEMDKDGKWQEIMHSIAEHAFHDYQQFETSPIASASAYTPEAQDTGTVINASAYRACLLMKAALDFSEDRYRQTAERNLEFVLESQNADGSWYYAVDGKRDFIDHFHTCFVLKALTKIENLLGGKKCTTALERGVNYYVRKLFDEGGLPKPFSKAPRLTIYRRELYNYAECINLAILLRGRFPELDQILATVLKDLLTRWQKPDGSFRSRQLLLGWDNVPMHRWAQSQVFRSLCFLLYRTLHKSPQDRIACAES